MRWTLVALIALGCGSNARKAPCDSPQDCVKQCKTNVAACIHGARSTLDGKLQPLDYNASFAMAQRACDSGDNLGCSLLGIHHQDGVGTKWAPATAVTIYRKGCDAAVMPDGSACYNLASMYIGGHGIPPDLDLADKLHLKANQLWQKACKESPPNWCTNAAFMAPETAEGDRERLALVSLACRHGDRVGCVEEIREQRRSDMISQATAKQRLTTLCNAGEATACTLAAAQGDLGKVSNEAIDLFDKGCQLGDKVACMVQFEQFQNSNKTIAMAAAKRACQLRLADGCLRAASLAADNAAAYPDLENACHFGSAEACDILAELSGDPKSPFAQVGCWMGWPKACARRIQAGLPLNLPTALEIKMFESACKNGVFAACN